MDQRSDHQNASHQLASYPAKAVLQQTNMPSVKANPALNHPDVHVEQGYFNPLSDQVAAGAHMATPAQATDAKWADFASFSDASVRKGFIRKVFFILAVQLLITTGICSWFLLEPNTKLFIHKHLEMLVVAIAVEIVVLIAIICFGELRRKTPINYILLFIFTLTKAYFVATLVSFYEVKAVLIAAGFTTAVCLGLCLFAFQTKWDFTMCGGFLFCSLLVFLLFGFSCIWLMDDVAYLVYASIGALLFSLYLVYDIQVMMGGGHRYSLSPEEYIFAALNLFIDVITIFVYILRIVGIASR
ncbi:unnamed protein product [Phyllotreta striolata]|uniref:Protein lifeguard 1 n=1 Tax=Phyllotreta striolata TaxID=444603 RepID=A0A9N9TNA4_PHYSR|nr:unnamed protein product [Phyllotreta striolata]